jgi:hypothetical protein
MIHRDRNLAQSPTDDTHKQSIVNRRLYTAYNTSHQHIVGRVLTEWTRHNETKDCSLTRDLLLNTLDKATLWQPIYTERRYTLLGCDLASVGQSVTPGDGTHTYTPD